MKPEENPRYRPNDVTEAPVPVDADKLRGELETHREMIQMFETKGWGKLRLFIERERELAQWTLTASAATMDQVNLARGKLHTLDYLLGLPTFHENKARAVQEKLAEIAAEEGDE